MQLPDGIGCKLKGYGTVVRTWKEWTGKRPAVAAPGILLVCCRCASRLNPSLDINQYAHKSRTVRDARELRVRMRDNGTGIDADSLRHEGRACHFGLDGMRERAKTIGAQLYVWGERGAGTEVELNVPSSVARGTAAGAFGSLRRSWGRLHEQ